jgi:tRNA(fMet)-specific endonuclease VapC
MAGYRYLVDANTLSDFIRNPNGSVTKRLEVLPLDGGADRHYAEIRAHLSRKGQPIGSNDLLIAAHALALDLTLVTANVDEFSRVPGLFIENWVVSQRP